jgi:hypothetical protein
VIVLRVSIFLELAEWSTFFELQKTDHVFGQGMMASCKVMSEGQVKDVDAKRVEGPYQGADVVCLVPAIGNI